VVLVAEADREPENRVVDEVLAHRCVAQHVDTKTPQVLRGADPRTHQDRGRVNRARRDDHLTSAYLGAVDRDPGGALAVKEDPLGVRVGANLEVRPAAHGLQKRAVRRNPLVLAQSVSERGDTGAARSV